MSSQVEQTGRILAEFDKTKSVDLLHGAVDQMAGVDLMPAPDTAARLAGRRAAARMWLRLLGVIDQNIDPRFDPKADAPIMRVFPPPVNGIQAGAMTDPAAIENPRVRAVYEAELKKNAERTENYNKQITFQRLDTRASELAKQFFTMYYTTSPADQQDLQILLDEHALQAARVRNIKKWFAEQPPPSH